MGGSLGPNSSGEEGREGQSRVGHFLLSAGPPGDVLCLVITLSPIHYIEVKVSEHYLWFTFNQ